MTIYEETQVRPVTLTSAAEEAVRNLFAQRNLEGYALRVFIQGGGCSGYQYGMALENNIRENDLVFDNNGVQVVVDEISIQHISGSNIDYIEDVMGSGFKVDNPNAVASCGCGSSFRAKEEAQSGRASGGGCSSC